MRVGVVVDSACDLPADYIAQHGIEVLPINLQLGDEALLDERDPEATVDFYRRYRSKKRDAGTLPPTVAQVAHKILQRAVYDYDRLLVVTISGTRSEICQRAQRASFDVLKTARSLREKTGVSGSFFMRIHDSKTLFTGQAVLVHEMMRLLREEGLGFDEVCRQADHLSDRVHAYLVPRDLYYLHHQARKKGDGSVNWFRYQAGSMLDIKPVILAHRGETAPVMTARGFDRALEKLLQRAEAAIEAGLHRPVVVISYAGPLAEIEDHPRLREFRRFAQTHGVELLSSVMSTTAGVNVGPGAFSLAYIAG